MGLRGLVVAAILLAGCLSTSGPSIFAPSRDLSLVAAKVAREWDDRASLVRIHGLEPSMPSPEAAALAGVPDDRRGDGRTQAWEYLFVGAAGAYGVVVGGDGGIRSRGTVTLSDHERVELVGHRRLEWNLDSDEIAQLVRRHVPDWEQQASASRIVHWYLLPPAGAEPPYWLVGFESTTTTRSYLVNSLNGSFLPLDLARFGGTQSPPWAGGREPALLTPQQPTHRLTFAVDAPNHPFLAFGLRVERTTTGTVNLTLARDGTDVDWLDWPASAPPGVRKEQVLWPANGTYELRARLTSLTPQPVELFWCAIGIPTTASAQHACRL